MSTVDQAFDRFVGLFLQLYTHSLTFIIAVVIVMVYLFNTDFQHQEIRESLRDVMTCIGFLIFFMVQKSVSRYSLAIQIKLNELVASHENARNEIVNIEQKSTGELQELAGLYEERDEREEREDEREEREDEREEREDERQEREDERELREDDRKKRTTTN